MQYFYNFIHTRLVYKYTWKRREGESWKEQFNHRNGWDAKDGEGKIRIGEIQ